MRLFSSAILASAALLFCVQPMIAKQLLPLFGGAPAVWNTCMLFFQALLLAGYAYAHVTSSKLGPRRQAALHLVVIAVAFVALPLSARAPAAEALDGAPIRTLLGLLARSVGLPFFVLSTTAPIVQRWFATVGGERAKDPYHLYAASNLGSLVALLGYPLALEPLAGLRRQSLGWSAGYGVFAALMACCAFVVLRARPTSTSEAMASVAAIAEPAVPARAPGWRLRAKWLALSLVPSSLLMGATQHITTDIAAIPLFWIVPLSLYLVSFMLVFARKPPLRASTTARLLPPLATASLLVVLVEATEPRWLLVAIHLATLFFACMVCHGELVRARPNAAHLTEFYLWMSLGGVAGGAINGVFAPLVLRSIAEYPAAIVAACFARPANAETSSDRDRMMDRVVPIALGAAAAAFALLSRARLVPVDFKFLVAAPVLVSYRWLHRPLRFAAGLGAIFLGSQLHPGAAGHVVAQERNFFGVVRVARDPGGEFVQIVHGHTVHGRQSTDPARKREPLTYFHPSGPAGDVFAHAARAFPGARVGVIGLGAGALAAYAQPASAWTFYEINPAVVRMANESFSFLRDAFPDGRGLRIVEGDARLRLQAEPDATFDLLVLDAFSSDAIPAHLLTRQAVALYAAKVTPDGFIAMHVSNRYLDLLAPIARLANDARLRALVRDDRGVTEEMIARGKSPSTWVALARSDRALDGLREAGWTELSAPAGPVWTDDFSNLVSAIRL